MNIRNIREHTHRIEVESISTETFPSSRAQFGGRALLVAMLMLAVATCYTQNGVAQQVIGTASSTAGAGGQRTMRILISVLLASSLDSKKLKTGDEVVLNMPANVVLKDGSSVPRGTRIVGHVTEAKARSRGDAESSLTIRFDRFDLPDGKNVAINGVIQAVGPDLSAAYPSGGGVDYTDLAQATYAPNVSVAARSVPVLTAQSVGVIGIKDLRLSADGELTSDSKSVKLTSGAQVLIQVQVSAGG